MTDKKKREPPMRLDMSFGEALGQLAQTDPGEMVDMTIAKVLQERQLAEKRIADAKKELDNGARPGKGRFRL